jgi:hypothetical protein
MQDERELIQDERRADADQHGGERLPAERARAADRREGSDNQQDDARNSVMNVRPARCHLVPERAAAIADHARDSPGHYERDDEGHKTQHQGKLARRDHVALPP